MDNVLSAMEIDAIGEVMNISLGSAATSVANMLSTKVDITTPVVKIRTRKEFDFKDMDPAIGVEIENEAGLTGSNVMILKRSDVKSILEMLMSMEFDDETFELDEMATSAIGEVMNQMMGSSATALSDLLGRCVDISTPKVFPIADQDEFKAKYFSSDDVIAEIGFNLLIGDNIDCQFVYLIPICLAKEILSGFMGDVIPMDEPAPVVAPIPEPVAPPPIAPVPEPIPVAPPVVEHIPVAPPVITQAPIPQAPIPQPYEAPVAYAPQPQAVPVIPQQLTDTLAQMMELMRQQMEFTQMQMARPSADPKKINVNAPARPNLNNLSVGGAYDTNLELVMGVPVEVSVEIGRTKKLVKDVLELNKGSLVVLDRMAGEQVDLYVNGQCIAQGDVVVVDDSFGIRITEITASEINITE